MRDKWHIKNNKKGYLKTHVAVNVKTKKILAMKVTDEHVRDIKASPGLVKDVLKSDNMTTTTTGKLFADGTYEGNEIFRHLGDNRILPCIKVRKRSLELDRKKEDTSLESYQSWHNEMICKSGKIAKTMERGGLLKRILLYKENVWRICLFGKV